MAQALRHRGKFEQARSLLLLALRAAELAELSAARGALLDDLAVVHLDVGADADAEHYALDALALHRRANDRRYEGISLGHLGLVAHLRGALDEATRRYEQALAIAQEIGDVRFDDFNRAFLAMVACEQSQHERARTTLGDRGRARDTTHEPDDPRAHALLACAEAALLAWLGKDHEAAEVLAHARTRLDADCDSELGALALLGAAIANAPAPKLEVTAGAQGIEQRLASRLVDALSHQREQPRGTMLEVGPAGRWFSIQGGARVSLARRRSLRLLFDYLLRLHAQRPGVGASWQELLDAGWPEEKVVASAGQRRVYVGIAMLRGLGLAEVIRRTDDGYLIDPSIVLRRTGS